MKNIIFLFTKVVIDNTNPQRKDRGEYIKIAQRFNVPIRCFKMDVDHQHALHNNKVLLIILWKYFFIM